MAQIDVTNSQQLLAALGAAAGGDTIVLAAGDYGALNLEGLSYSSGVTITSAVKHAAAFSSIELSNSDHLRFDGVSVDGVFRTKNGSDSIWLTNSDVDGGVSFNDAASIRLEGNDITSPSHGAIFNDVRYVTMTGNVVHHVGEDAVRITGNSFGFKIEGNTLYDAVASSGSPDMIQVFAKDGFTPHDLTIRDNVIYDDPASGLKAAKGIFVASPAEDGYKNVLIEDNLVNVGSVNSIYVDGAAENVMVRDNTVSSWESGAGGTIRLVEKSSVGNTGATLEGNTAKSIRIETSDLSSGMTIGSNTIDATPGVAPPPPPPEADVHSAAGLLAALQAATGGETIILGEGDYGALDLGGLSFASGVTLKSAVQYGASFASVEISGSDHLRFDGVHVRGVFRTKDGTDSVWLINSDLDGGVSFNDAASVRLEGNDITSPQHGVIFNDVRYVTMTGNVVHHVGEDFVRITGNSFGFKVEGNTLYDAVSVSGSPDMIQVYAAKGVTPHDLTIRDNVLYDDPATGAKAAKGIFLASPTKEGYVNVLVEDNVVNVGSVNSIYLDGGAENVVIRDNVVSPWENGAGGVIRVVEKSGVGNTGTVAANNTAKSVKDETTALSKGVAIGPNTIDATPGAKMPAPPSPTPSVYEPAPAPEPDPITSPISSPITSEPVTDGVSGPTWSGSTTTVSNATQLKAALATANGGETIVLASGAYGDLKLTDVSYASNVTIKSASSLGAAFGNVEMAGVVNLTFDAVSVDGVFRAKAASHGVALKNSDVDGYVSFNQSWGMTIDGNDITGGEHGIIFNDVHSSTVSNNYVHHVQSDLFRAGGNSHHLVIEDNLLFDAIPIPGDHPDMIQIFGNNGFNGHDITIRGNVLYDDPNTGSVRAQGIFVSNPMATGYSNVLVEDNLVNVGHTNSIYINGGSENVVVRGNLVAPWTDGQGGTIRIVEKNGVSNSGTSIYDNTMKSIMDETTSLSSGISITGNTIDRTPLSELLSLGDSSLDLWSSTGLGLASADAFI